MKKQTKKQIQEEMVNENQIIQNNIKEWRERKQQNENKPPKKCTYYFDLEDETISIRLNQRTREELNQLKELFNAKKVFTYLNGCTLIYDLN